MTAVKPTSGSQPGLYLHSKGGTYILVCVAEMHEHNGDLDVIYISLKHGKFVTRPLRQDSRKQASWLDVVEWPDGKKRERFVPMGALSQLEYDGLRVIWNDTSGVRGLSSALARVLEHVGAVHAGSGNRLDMPELVAAAEAFCKSKGEP